MPISVFPRSALLAAATILLVGTSGMAQPRPDTITPVSPSQPAVNMAPCTYGNYACCSDPTCYIGFRNGGIYQYRTKGFRFGEVALDANDVDSDFEDILEDLALIHRPKFGLDDWGYTPEVFIGRVLNSCWSIEGRFAYADFSTNGKFGFVGGGGSNGSFWVPFLDGSETPRFQGIAGIRMFAANVDFRYESELYDLGVDLLHHSVRNERDNIGCIFGLAFASIDQKFNHDVNGLFGGGLNQLRQSFTREKIDDDYYGIRLGVFGSHRLTKRVSIGGQFSVYLYYQDAELDAVQDIETDGGPPIGPRTIEVSDSRSDFVPRLDLSLNVNWALSDCLTLMLGYRFSAWFDVAAVENPRLTAVFDGDPYWVGDRPARLTGEDLFTNTFTIGILYSR